MIVRIPAGVFDAAGKERLVKELNDAAAAAERIPEDRKSRFLCWVVIDEAAPGAWTCGGVDVMPWLIPVMAVIYVPAGVLDDESRALYARLVDAAFKAAAPDGGTGRVVSSVVLHDVPDGAWGASGNIWTLADIAARAGYEHLRHLVKPSG